MFSETTVQALQRAVTVDPEGARRVAQKAFRQRMILEMVLDTIQDAGNRGAPSGPMYAAFMGYGVSLDAYNGVLAELRKRGCIREQFHVCYFVKDLAPVDSAVLDFFQACGIDYKPMRQLMAEAEAAKHKPADNTPMYDDPAAPAEEEPAPFRVPEAKFRLGQVVATPGAQEAFERTGEQYMTFLRRHVTGDWGTVDKHDARENELSLRNGFRIMSVYQLADETKIWVITEADRSATTFLLPSEY